MTFSQRPPLLPFLEGRGQGVGAAEAIAMFLVTTSTDNPGLFSTLSTP
jgi:hypothetical protein